MPRPNAARVRTDDPVASLWSRMLDLAVEPDNWQPLLVALRDALSARVCTVCQFDFETKQGRVIANAGFRPERVKAYESTFGAGNIWLRREEQYREAGKVVADTGVSTKELTESEFFRSWLAPQKLFHRLCLVLARQNGRLWYLSVMRARASGPFDADDKALLESLAPQLCSIFSVQCQLGRIRSERDAYREALNQLSFGVVIMDEADRPLYLNRSAEALLDKDEASLDQLSVSLDGDRATGQRIGKLLTLAQAKKPNGRKRNLGLEFSRYVGHQMSVAVKPLDLPEHSALNGDWAARSLLILSDPDRQAAPDHQTLCELFGLTPSEARLAAHIVMGQTVEAAAALLGLTANTARRYLQHVFSKTGTNRQAELVRLVFSTVGPIRTD